MAKKLQPSGLVSLMCVAFCLLCIKVGQADAVSSWSPTLLVNTEAFQVIDDSDVSANLELRFGSELNARIAYDRIEGRFVFSKPVLIQGLLTVTGSLKLTRSNLSGAILYTSGTTIMRTQKSESGQILIGQGTAGPVWRSPLGGMVWYFDGVQTTGTTLGPQVTMPISITLSSVTMSIKGAPTGSPLIVDIRKNGTTIFTTKPRIGTGALTGGSGAVFSQTILPAGSLITLDITQVGSTFAGSGLTVMLSGVRHY